MYVAQASLFQYVFLDFDMAKSYKHHVEASNDATMLGKVMQKMIKSSKRHTGLIKMLMGLLGPGGELPDTPGFGKDMVLRLLDGGKSVLRRGSGAGLYPGAGCCHPGCSGKSSLGL